MSQKWTYKFLLLEHILGPMTVILKWKKFLNHLRWPTIYFLILNHKYVIYVRTINLINLKLYNYILLMIIHLMKKFHYQIFTWSYPCHLYLRPQLLNGWRLRNETNSIISFDKFEGGHMEVRLIWAKGTKSRSRLNFKW